MVTKKYLVYYNLKKHMKAPGKGKIISQLCSFVRTIVTKTPEPHACLPSFSMPAGKYKAATQEDLRLLLYLPR
jgi:hypothetical protein